MNTPSFVPPAQIESELTRIWESLEGTNKMRACLFNLILYTEKNRRSDYIHKIAQKVIERFPSRVILISADNSSKEDCLKTSVSVLSGAKGEYDVVCDFIEIEVSGAEKVRTPFLILPHLLPDLPVYFLFAEDPVKEDPISYELEKFADRIIFDSETTEDVPRFAVALLRHKETSEVDIADLNWARLENWRELLSITFYTEERLEQLQKAKKICILYNAQETPFFCHTGIQSLYLQAWLSCQLNWELKEHKVEKETMRFTYQKVQSTVLFEITAERHPNIAPGAILSLSIETEEEEHFAFKRNLDSPHQVSMEISTPVKCDIPIQFVFAKTESGQSLVKEICHKGTSAHYLKVLNFLKTIQLC